MRRKRSLEKRSINGGMGEEVDKDGREEGGEKMNEMTIGERKKREGKRKKRRLYGMTTCFSL